MIIWHIYDILVYYNNIWESSLYLVIYDCNSEELKGCEIIPKKRKKIELSVNFSSAVATWRNDDHDFFKVWNFLTSFSVFYLGVDVLKSV